MTDSASKPNAVARDPEPGTAVVATNSSSSVVASQTQARLTAEMREKLQLKRGVFPRTGYADVKRWLEMVQSLSLPQAGGEPLKALDQIEDWLELLDKDAHDIDQQAIYDACGTVRSALKSSPAGAEGQEIASTEQDMASRVDGQSCPDRPSASTGSTAPRD